MPTIGSVTHWLGDLKAGAPGAAQKLWGRYVLRLVQLARAKLGSTPRRGEDEEDAVQAAFGCFFSGVQDRRFPKLDDRHDLWRLLVVLTERKVINQIRKECRRAGQALPSGPVDTTQDGLGQVPDREPTPEFAVQVAEEYDYLLNSLEDPDWQRIAVWKLEGQTNDEIAAALDCSRRTVERRLEMIRERWQALGRRPQS